MPVSADIHWQPWEGYGVVKTHRMLHNYRSLSAKHPIISAWFPECDLSVVTFSRYGSHATGFYTLIFFFIFFVSPPPRVPASVDIYWWQIYTITGHIVTDWHLAQGYAPTIENRRRASSPCPLLNNLGCPHPRPPPWLFPFIYLFLGFQQNVNIVRWDSGRNPILSSVYLTGSHLDRIFPSQRPSSQIARDRNGSTGQVPLLELKTFSRYDQGSSSFEVRGSWGSLKIKRKLVVPRESFKF